MTTFISRNNNTKRLNSPTCQDDDDYDDVVDDHDHDCYYDDVDDYHHEHDHAEFTSPRFHPAQLRPQIEDISADYKQYFSEPMGYIHLGVVVLCAYVIVCLDRKKRCQQKWLEDKSWLTQ